MLSSCPPDVLDEILDLIESVSEGFPTYSQDQTLVLAALAFSPSSDELDRSSSPGHGHFLCLRQENSLPYGC